MKAPDKKYPLSVVADLLASTPPNEVVFMPDKIYFDGVDTSTIPRLAINVEYIRKDALLEWLNLAVECYSHPDTVNVIDTIRCEGKKWGFQDVINKIESL